MCRCADWWSNEKSIDRGKGQPGGMVQFRGQWAVTLQHDNKTEEPTPGGQTFSQESLKIQVKKKWKQRATSCCLATKMSSLWHVNYKMSIKVSLSHILKQITISRSLVWICINKNTCMLFIRYTWQHFKIKCKSRQSTETTDWIQMRTDVLLDFLQVLLGLRLDLSDNTFTI